MVRTFAKESRANMRGVLKEALSWPRVWVQLQGIERDNPILVYQMGKVGSSSVVDTLRANGCGPVLQMHTLTQGELKRAVDRQRRSRQPFLPEHLIVSSLLLRRMQRRQFPYRVITLTREPVSRAISHVFEANKQKLTQDGGGSLAVEEARSVVIELLEGENGIADPTRWFDQELRAVTGVDVFSKPYDVEQGFTVFDTERVPVLIVRMEDVNRSLAQGLSSFLGIPIQSDRLRSANVGGTKWYGGELQEVKQSLRLPAETAERVFSTRYARHFYAQDLPALRERWT